MSIATQIQRLLNAKSAIKSSITNKSVTVGETVMLDSYHTYISQIGSQSNIGPADVLFGKKAFGNNGKYFNGTALSIATSANNAVILNGFTAYDSNGQLLNGSAMPSAATALNNRILNGFTAYDNKGNLLKGNAFANNTNATNASLLKGHTAYLNNGVWLNGTAFGDVTNATNAQILSGQRAYLNNGLYLNGTMVNKAGTTQTTSSYLGNNSYISLNIPTAGYYTTTSRIRHNAAEVLDDMGNAFFMVTGTYTISESDVTDNISITGLPFTPQGCVFICQEPGNFIEFDEESERYIFYGHDINGSKNCGYGRWWDEVDYIDVGVYGRQNETDYVDFTYSAGSCKFRSPGYWLTYGKWDYMIWGTI